jgi:hypothetical protein
MMKNVMVRAWEIARAAVVKFGGKVKEYFAAALRQAWSEARNAKQFGFMVISKVNGMMYFAVEGAEVAAYDKEFSNRTGKPYMKRHIFSPRQTGVNKTTGCPAQIYSISLGTNELEISKDGAKATLKINRGLLAWAN